MDLPNRRATETIEIGWMGKLWRVSIYLDHDGSAREIFITPAIGVDGARPGSDIHSAINITAIVVSKLLQYGETLERLIVSLTVGEREKTLNDPRDEDPLPIEPPLIIAALRAAREMEIQYSTGEL